MIGKIASPMMDLDVSAYEPACLVLVLIMIQHAKVLDSPHLLNISFSWPFPALPLLPLLLPLYITKVKVVLWLENVCYCLY